MGRGSSISILRLYDIVFLYLVGAAVVMICAVLLMKSILLAVSVFVLFLGYVWIAFVVKEKLADYLQVEDDS